MSRKTQSGTFSGWARRAHWFKVVECGFLMANDNVLALPDAVVGALIAPR